MLKSVCDLVKLKQKYTRQLPLCKEEQSSYMRRFNKKKREINQLADKTIERVNKRRFKEIRESRNRKNNRLGILDNKKSRLKTKLNNVRALLSRLLKRKKHG